MSTAGPATIDREGLRRRLGAARVRPTRQRVEVLAALLASDHPTVEELFERARLVVPRISLATVYKALDLLVAHGFAEKLTTPGGPSRFDGRTERHDHLRCLRSGAVRDLPIATDDGLLERLEPGLIGRLADQGFRVTGYRLEVLGFDEGGGDLGGASP